MEQIELVIKMPKDVYEDYWHLGSYELRKIISNGTPLPKGHGALIDRKSVIDVIEWYRLNPQHFSIDNVIDDIKCMEFVVEADEEGAEE